jgi:hypothetical protein
VAPEIRRISADHGAVLILWHRCGANSASKAWCSHLFFIVFVIVCLAGSPGSSGSSVPWAFVVFW